MRYVDGKTSGCRNSADGSRHKFFMAAFNGNLFSERIFFLEEGGAWSSKHSTNVSEPVTHIY